MLAAIPREAEESNLAAASGPCRSSCAIACAEQKAWDSAAKSNQVSVSRFLIQQVRQNMEEEKPLEIKKTKVRVHDKV